MRIKYIVPFPFDEVGLANRAAQLPDELRTPGVDYEFVPVRNSCHNADSAYELLILDMYIAEAGFASEEEGYDAVVMGTVSDSGLAALRSRLTIPVLGPGSSSSTSRRCWQAVLDPHDVGALAAAVREDDDRVRHGQYCASIRSIGKRPDQEQLLARSRGDRVRRARARGRAAIEEDHADVILIGSTTMHQSVEHLRQDARRPGHQPRAADDQARRAVRHARAHPLQGGLHGARGHPGREVQLAHGGLSARGTPAAGGGASRSTCCTACAAAQGEGVAPGRRARAARRSAAPPRRAREGIDAAGRCSEAPRVREPGELGGDGDHVRVGLQRRRRVRRRRRAGGPRRRRRGSMRTRHVAHAADRLGRRPDRRVALPSSSRRRTSSPKRPRVVREALAVQAGASARISSVAIPRRRRRRRRQVDVARARHRGRRGRRRRPACCGDGGLDVLEEERRGSPDRAGRRRRRPSPPRERVVEGVLDGVRVVAVVAGHHREHLGDVRDRPRHRPDRVERGADRERAAVARPARRSAAAR